jgi:D-inositol-3-phosphate glycosyltransferase
VDRAFFGPGDQDQARRAVGLPADVPLALFVGRVQPLKGLSVAIEAIAELKGRPGRAGRACLVVVGGPSGPRGEWELARSKTLIAERELGGRVWFVPPQPHELLSTYYRAADVCVVPSRSESFGLVALEAAACALPVVASAVGGLTTLVDHGRTGYLVEPGTNEVARLGTGHGVVTGNTGDFARYLSELLADRSLARCMGAVACERSKNYTWPLAAHGMTRLYTKLAQRELVSCA